jgi:methylmalonyl-CoA mutase N-terminal domain/subunit
MGDSGILYYKTLALFGFLSGYAREAGANQLHNWLTALSDFTYVEYYLSRGMNINDFGPNLSFFFEWVVEYYANRSIWRVKFGRKP